MDFLFNEIVVLVVSGLFIIYIALSIMYIERYKKKKELEYQNYLYTLAHEVKGPLSICKGYIEIMNKNKKYSKGKVSIIEKELNDSLSIMDEYLVMRKSKVNLEYIDVGLLIDEVCDSYKSLTCGDNINIKVDNKACEYIIKGDYIRLKEAINNIIKNSIESKTDKRDLNINMKLKKSFNNVNIEIDDNGSGISSSSVGKCYYTNKVNGNGIGVMYTKNIIKLHKGKIDYIKKRNGTLVKISIPLAIS